ncbi:MAG: hypothetical protein IID15_04020 [Candidatus Marinimicrobia bacterium]|nr:hypothetical protein [Candidatus Neomarinimicrobiota bacterium]
MKRVTLQGILLVGLTIVFANGCMAHKGMAGKNGMGDDHTAMAGPTPEANAPITMDVAFANIDRGMKMMGDMEAMMKHVMMVQQTAMKEGETLYNDPEIAGATRGISCNSCHPSGATTGGEAQIPAMLGYPGWKMPIPSLIGAAATFPKFKVPNANVISLAQMNNNCISMFVGGKRLPLNGEESHALNMYVTSLSNGTEVAPGKMGM